MSPIPKREIPYKNGPCSIAWSASPKERRAKDHRSWPAGMLKLVEKKFLMMTFEVSMASLGIFIEMVVG